MKAKQLL